MGTVALIVLDTHAWIWWRVSHRRLSRRAARAIDDADQIGISPMSVWEVARLTAAGKMSTDRPIRQWVQMALADERVAMLPVTPEIAFEAGSISGALRDPADQIIYASAVEHHAQLLTRDERMHELDPARAIW